MDTRFFRLTTSVGRLQKLIQKIKTEGMGQVDLKGSHTVVLCLLAACPEGLHFAELTERCELDPALISRVLASLTRAGYVNKDGAPGKYNALYTLTPEGLQCADRVNTVITAFRQKADKDISPEELETFYSVLDRMTANLEGALQEKTTLFAPLQKEN